MFHANLSELIKAHRCVVRQFDFGESEVPQRDLALATGDGAAFEDFELLESKFDLLLGVELDLVVSNLVAECREESTRIVRAYVDDLGEQIINHVLTIKLF